LRCGFRRCQFIISLNCVFYVCVRVCESVCVCMDKYKVTVVIVNLLSFYSLQRVVEVVGMIREVCDSWQNPNRRCLAQQNSSRLATLIYSFFLLLLGAVRPPNGMEGGIGSVLLAENGNGMS